MSGRESIEPDLLRRIDRLVDNELGEPERRELLLELDRRPDAWKLCALAFLENQAWAPAIREVVVLARPSPAPPPARRRHRWLAAACVMSSLFGLGVLSGTMLRRETPEPTVAANPPVAPLPDAPRLAGFVQLTRPGEAPGNSIPIPVLSGTNLKDRLTEQARPMVPEYVRSVWERQGYELRENREVVSLGLDDGRRVAIPVDQVQVKYVGQIPY